MKVNIIFFVITLIHKILCEDILEKLKQTIKDNSNELLKEMNAEIEKLQKAEDFSVIQIVESGIINSLKNNDLYEKEKEIFIQIENEFSKLKAHPSLIKAEEFLENSLKIITNKFPSTNDLVKNIKQILTIVKSLSPLVIPKALQLPSVYQPTPYPSPLASQETRDQIGNNNRIPRPHAPSPSPHFNSRWNPDDNQYCNADNCSGCCIKSQCFPLEECKMYFISHTIIMIVVLCLVCCGCCGLALGAICYFHKKRQDLISSQALKNLPRNETTSSESPVQGIPVQQPIQGVVIGQQLNRQQGFNVLAEETQESPREVQLSEL